MRVLIVDDHPLFLDGLTNLLTSHGVEVVGTARDGLEALEKARGLRPEVILMDIQMPHLDGLAATRLLKAEFPDIVVVMLTMSAEGEDLFEAIKCGAAGYLLKTQDTEEFFSLLMRMSRGEMPLSPGLAGRLLKEFARQASKIKAMQSVADREGSESLSNRQIEVLTLVAQGMTYKEVGAKLSLSERGVKYHMGEIRRRLQLEQRAQVIDYARRSGLITGR